MKVRNVNLNLVSKVKDFCEGARHIDGDILAKQGHAVIDATSMLGLFSLALDRDIEVEYIGENEEAFDNFIKDYV